MVASSDRRRETNRPRRSGAYSGSGVNPRNLEGDVVAVAATAAADPSLLEVGGVGGHVGLALETVAIAAATAAVTRAQELDLVGDDLDGLALLPLLVLPLAPVEAALD